ncbi:3-alpha-hydroxycholanate dehydrogenase (NADP(+)) [bioreactor metagenome]|uniref:3-alpha-hydroxycholanate dehydrogenase (NADP(+)) n=1 Tax=bioreactor metagenome TaxID=1076179 RepID=A0A644YTY3_9ZZZZ
MSTYAATKGAVNQITRSLAQEYAPYNIRFNAVAPGMTWTGKMIPGSAHANASIAVIPLGRAGEPMEQAYAALFFASDECRYCTGAILNIDGGQSCGAMRHED